MEVGSGTTRKQKTRKIFVWNSQNGDVKAANGHDPLCKYLKLMLFGFVYNMSKHIFVNIVNRPFMVVFYM